MIQYLLKFVSKKDYANDFVQGKLYMNTSDYYRRLESKYGVGQGDIAEASISSTICEMTEFCGPIGWLKD